MPLPIEDLELIIRFDYGSLVPWVRRADGTLLATAGPDTLELHTKVDVRGEDMKTVAEFHVSKGERTHCERPAAVTQTS